MKEEMLLLEYKKRCRCCGEYGGKDGCSFYKSKLNKDGLQGWCIVCIGEAVKKYRRSERGKRIRKHYNQSEDRRQRNKRYNQSKRGKQVRKRYNQSETNLLSDLYIKQAIRQHYKIKAKDITPEMIEAKRELLTFHRLEKELNDGINSAGN